MTERRYDPELAAIVPALPTESDFSDMPTVRSGMAQMFEQLGLETTEIAGVRWEEARIAATRDTPEILVRVYTPEGAPEDGAAARPGVLYIHGGGFITGSVEAEHGPAASVASECDAVVVSVEYRLAPEHPFPAGLDDCYSALVWMHAEAKALGIDVEHVGVMGSSAGGGLSAALALLARDRGGPHLCFQGLGIPELDDRLETTSMREFTDTPLWNRPNAIVSWRYYLGADAPAEVSPYAAPARAENLRNLPPAYVSTMEYDPLRDEGIVYALRMLEAGVSVELHQFPGTFHGSHLIGAAEVSKRVTHEMTAAMRRGLRR